MPKIIDKKEKTQIISQAALTVFRDRGYYRTRMVDIAAAAGIGKGTLYEYFKNKSDILQFAFEEYFDVFSQGLLDVLQTKDEPTPKLIALIDFALSHAVEWEDHCMVYVEYFSSARSDNNVPFSLSAIYGSMKDVLVTIIREGQQSGEFHGSLDPVAVSEMLVSMYDGIILHRLFAGRGIDRDTLRETTLHVLKSGLLDHR
ncbi:MAG: TetR/AcrR family transcriptional regulator [Deltaproteobacteria bacterium]|nr:TetR/AcrR family transcriptional regulator [Deltaproteobacteria bacterium]